MSTFRLNRFVAGLLVTLVAAAGVAALQTHPVTGGDVVAQTHA